MAKLSTSSIERPDLEEYLKNCDDFQFEIDVFRSCVGRDSSAVLGGTYQDPITAKDRQFDIRMTIVNGRRRLSLAVECKNLKPYFPLMISRLSRRREESYHHTIVFNGSFALTAKFHGDKCYYKPKDIVGKSTVQVGRTPSKEIISNDADVFEKWSQALASASELICTEVRKTGFGSVPLLKTVVVPVLVVANDTLWVVDYNDRGEVADGPKRVDQAIVYVGKVYHADPQHPERDYRVSHLHVYTKKGFDKFLSDMSDDDEWAEFFPEE